MRLSEHEPADVPPKCLDCVNCKVYRGVNADMSRIETRAQCIHSVTGGVMRYDCTWHERRTRSTT